jgi:hypothetical protein
MAEAPFATTPPPTTEATMAIKIEQLDRGLLPWQVSSINHIQKGRLPHLMGEMISLIWLA